MKRINGKLVPIPDTERNDLPGRGMEMEQRMVASPIKGNPLGRGIFIAIEQARNGRVIHLIKDRKRYKPIIDQTGWELDNTLNWMRTILTKRSDHSTNGKTRVA